MKWLGRMLFRPKHEAPPPPVITSADRIELASAQATHTKLLSRADEAIREAMAHADEVFVYRGPDRRGHPR